MVWRRVGSIVSGPDPVRSYRSRGSPRGDLEHEYAPLKVRSEKSRRARPAKPCFFGLSGILRFVGFGTPGAKRTKTWWASATAVLALGLWGTPAPADAAQDDVLLEFHFEPVPNAQIAIWLEDAEGNHLRDVFVTQATGTLGIGNRPGRWDFLSSWRFPYGPRPMVLPVWAHARGKSYPKLVFHDDNPDDANSLGWHENSSSPEPYFCRPLTETEHQTISTDTMTCPSPSTFQSDKGRFDAVETSVYPPRADLVSFEDGHDHPDVMQFGAINDLDSVTGATPAGNQPEVLTVVLDRELAERGPLRARVEINLEGDGNDHWDFDREDDHFVDPRLSSFGIAWRGQPSVVYAVEFDPMKQAFSSTDSYEGYGSLDGTSGALSPPDDTISTEGGSGADRLRLHEKNGEQFRFGVYSHGANSGSGGDPDSPWGGSCKIQELPAMAGVELEPLDFDTVRVHFTVPDDTDLDIRKVVLYYRAGGMPLTEDNVSSAIAREPTQDQCGAAIEPGVSTWCDVDQLFGSSDYQIGIRYEDACSNRSNLVAGEVTTPAQDFETVEGFCVVATAAWGAPWAGKVQALRWFRDLYLRSSGVGSALVAFYYAHGPKFARVAATNELARLATRQLLMPAAGLAVATTDPG